MLFIIRPHKNSQEITEQKQQKQNYKVGEQKQNKTKIQNKKIKLWNSNHVNSQCISMLIFISLSIEDSYACKSKLKNPLFLCFFMHGTNSSRDHSSLSATELSNTRSSAVVFKDSCFESSLCFSIPVPSETVHGLYILSMTYGPSSELYIWLKSRRQLTRVSMWICPGAEFSQPPVIMVWSRSVEQTIKVANNQFCMAVKTITTLHSPITKIGGTRDVKPQRFS